jgi:hypothetical protein
MPPNLTAPVSPDDHRLVVIDTQSRALLAERLPLEARFWSKPKLADLEAVANAMIVLDDKLDALMHESFGLKATTPAALRAKARLLHHEY